MRGGVDDALEAMAAGIPVVGWRTPELLEIVDDGVSGFLVNTGDRTALASRLNSLLNEPELAARMGQAGRARVREHYNISRVIEHYLRVYEELSRR